MPQACCYRFAYHMPGRHDRRRLNFVLRDGDAANFITNALTERGYRYKGPLFNFPPPKAIRAALQRRERELIPFDTGIFSAHDVIVLDTRPPMEDLELGDKKGFSGSYTTLEEMIFQAIRVWISRCARSEIVLTAAAARVSAEIEARASMVIRQNGSAGYQSYSSLVTGASKRFGKAEALTPVFLVQVEHAWPNGPALMAAFGAGGTETMVWSYLLTTRFAHLLGTTPFVMAEMRADGWPKHPESMRFADSWDIDILGVAKPGLSENAA